MTYPIGKPPHLKWPNARFSDLAHLKYYEYGESSFDASSTDRKSYKVRMRGDTLYLRHPITREEVPLPPGDHRYVVTPKGSLYLSPGRYPGRECHANILRHRPVQCAGYLTVEAGRILAINRHSGHYQPTLRQFELTVTGLMRRGLISRACLTKDGAACVAKSAWGSPPFEVELRDIPAPYRGMWGSRSDMAVEMWRGRVIVALMGLAGALLCVGIGVAIGPYMGK